MASEFLESDDNGVLTRMHVETCMEAGTDIFGHIKSSFRHPSLCIPESLNQPSCTRRHSPSSNPAASHHDGHWREDQGEAAPRPRFRTRQNEHRRTRNNENDYCARSVHLPIANCSAPDICRARTSFVPSQIPQSCAISCSTLLSMHSFFNHHHLCKRQC